LNFNILEYLMPLTFRLKRRRYDHHGKPVINQANSLAVISAGEAATVLAIHGDRQVTSRLASLGLTPGVQVDMLRNYGHGPLIISVRGTRVALGRGEASKIEVQR
jgi:ferrous iron transport protein A